MAAAEAGHGEVAGAAGSCPDCAERVPAGAAYCPACGQRWPVHRLTLHEVGHELVHSLVHVDRSVLSLVRALLLHPGRVARDYALGRRRRYYGPFAFLVVVVALASACIALSGFAVVTSNVPNRVGAFLQAHANLLFFLQVPLLALACRLLAWRDRWNYAEQGVLAAYAGGMHVLWYVLVVIPGWLLLRHWPGLMQRLYIANAAVFPAYFGWANSEFRSGPRLVSFLAGVLAVVLASAATQLLVSAITSALA